jgi:hypothetical protein
MVDGGHDRVKYCTHTRRGNLNSFASLSYSVTTKKWLIDGHSFSLALLVN